MPKPSQVRRVADAETEGRPAPRAAAWEGQPTRDVILRALREIYAGPAWHGPSMREALRGVSPDAAARRVAPGRNTIWELVLHLAYTRHRLLHRMGAAEERQFPRRFTKSWWPAAPAEPTPAAWRADLALLADYQARLVAAVGRAPLARLRITRPGQRRTIAHELLGVAFHDAYHAGQIRLLARLAAEAAAGAARRASA